MNIIEAKMNRYGVSARSDDLFSTTMQYNVTVDDGGEVDEFSR
jgi:hypothetical protein